MSAKQRHEGNCIQSEICRRGSAKKMSTKHDMSTINNKREICTYTKIFTATKE